MGEARRRKLAGGYPNATERQSIEPDFSNLPTVYSPPRTSAGTTPAIPLKPRVRDFIRRLGGDPHLLPYTDVGAGYILRCCHLNVAHRVKHHGGGRVFGWMVWDYLDFTEGEFHAVWKSPTGELMDVTPRVDGEDFVLFVPDLITTVEPVGDGARIPANRTTIPGIPYTMLGQPSGKAVVGHPDARTRAHMGKLGMAHFIGEA